MERSLPELPDEIISDIFRYADVTSNEVIQYSLLSKQLQRVMQTRPILGFYTIRRRRPCEPVATYILYYKKAYEGQLNYIISNLDRYCRENIPLETLQLKMKEIYLSNLISVKHSNYYVLPQYVFEAESLVELNLDYCCLKPNGTISWPNLRRLKMFRIYGSLADEELFGKIIRGCPSIEYLKVVGYGWILPHSIFKVVNLRNLKQLNFESYEDEHMEVNATPNLESINIAGRIDFGDTEYPRLKSIKLTESRELDESFFTNFAYKFPILENLCIYDCCNLHGINLSSKSLEEIRLGCNLALQEAYFDVPNLVHFEYEDDKIIPRLTVTGSLGGWSSCIKLEEDLNNINASWFMILNEFLAELNMSETSITVSISGTRGFFDEVHPIIVNPFIPIPRIRKFTINANQSAGISLSSVNALVDGVFSICLPRTITVRVWHKNISRLLDEKNLLREKMVSKSSHHHCSVTDFKLILCTGEEFKLPFEEYWDRCFDAVKQDETIIEQMSYQLEYCSEI